MSSLTRLHTPREIPIRLDAAEEHQQVLAQLVPRLSIPIGP